MAHYYQHNYLHSGSECSGEKGFVLIDKAGAPIPTRWTRGGVSNARSVVVLVLLSTN